MTLISVAAMFVLVLGAQRLWRGLPDRAPMAERIAAVRFLPREAPSGMRMWGVEVDDRRWAGASALVVDDGKLLALTDSGVLAWLPFPGRGTTARLRDLPDGPRKPDEKRNRDSEALVRAADGGWWVAFEYRHSLWHFDQAFGRGTQVQSLRGLRWPNNKGVEAMLPGKAGRVRLLPEAAQVQITSETKRSRPERIAGLEGEIADAVRTPDGRDLLLLRAIGVGGIVNRLARLEQTRAGWRAQTIAVLPLGPFDNAEGIAVKALPGGGTRLWIVTDNDGSAFRETRLLTMVLP